MPAPIVRTSATTASEANVSSFTVNKPSGLVAGDIMLAPIGFMHTGAAGRSVSAPAGWTQLQQLNENRVVLAVFWKTATSGDVAASNFTFTFSGAVDDFHLGAIIRIDGQAVGSEIADSEIDANTSPGDAVVSFTGDSAPTVNEALGLAIFVGGKTSGGGMTTSTYTLTPSYALTEIVDITASDSGTGGVLAVASFNTTNTATITAYGATFSATPDRAELGALVAINAPQNASADISHLAITPTVESATGSNTATATIDHLAITPTVENVTGKSTSDMTRWTNETKNDTDWTNETI